MRIPTKSVSGFSAGTSFEVRDLFFNVPVRLKFLKRPETELQLISDMVREMAIAHPEVKFELINKNYERVFNITN